MRQPVHDGSPLASAAETAVEVAMVEQNYAERRCCSLSLQQRGSTAPAAAPVASSAAEASWYAEEDEDYSLAVHTVEKFN